MKRISMIAVTDFEWDSVEYTAGKRFEVTPVEASVLHRRRHARFVTDEDPLIEEPLPPPAPVIETAKEAVVTVRRPRRKRRDISRAEHTKADA